MDRRVCARRLSSAGRRVLALLAALLLGSLGCKGPQTRLQAEDDNDRDKYEVKTIGDVSTFANAEGVPVAGVGLVIGLDGTGGDAPPGGHRGMLEDILRKRGVENVKEVLASKNHSLVLVSAVIPPGARDGDLLDIEVTLPPGSKTTSLRGGYLKQCQLFTYDSRRNLSPGYEGPDQVFKGHPVVHAEGPVVVSVGNGDEAGRLRSGHVWSGGHCKKGFPFYLVLNSDQQFARLASAIAERVNETFHGAFPAAPNSQMAVAMNKSLVVLSVPAQYKHNLPRYLRVVRAVPLTASEKLKEMQENTLRDSSTAVSAATRMSYRKRLEEELLDPSRTVTAALRLEALGADSAPVLQKGLESEHVLVRFCSAEALAYLDSSTAGEELARLVEQQPTLRAFSLTALASLSEAVSSVELSRLLASPSPETRYGAFRALRAMNDRDPQVQGEMMNESYWLHRVTPNTEPLIHLASSKRAEIILFGESPSLVAPCWLQTGDFTVTADQETQRCTICRLSVRKGEMRRQCSLKVEDVLRALADMGGLYTEAVEILRQADRAKSLTCAVAVDALPQATSVYELAKTAARDPGFFQNTAVASRTSGDFGATPTLFEKPASPRSTLAKDEEALLRDRQHVGDKKMTAERRAKAGK